MQFTFKCLWKITNDCLLVCGQECAKLTLKINFSGAIDNFLGDFTKSFLLIRR